VGEKESKLTVHLPSFFYRHTSRRRKGKSGELPRKKEGEDGVEGSPSAYPGRDQKDISGGRIVLLSMEVSEEKKVSKRERDDSSTRARREGQRERGTTHRYGSTNDPPLFLCSSNLLDPIELGRRISIYRREARVPFPGGTSRGHLREGEEDGKKGERSRRRVSCVLEAALLDARREMGKKSVEQRWGRVCGEVVVVDQKCMERIVERRSCEGRRGTKKKNVGGDASRTSSSASVRSSAGEVFVFPSRPKTGSQIVQA